jgi:hypothetical protein
MSDSTIEETRRKLDDLEQQIKAAKSSVPSETLAAQAQADWDNMVASHAEISRRLAADQSSAVVEGARLDIDVLRNSFERWMSRVESNYTGGKPR